jgi:hypothetical protein
MTTLTVEIDKEQDLTAIISELDKLGLKYHIGDEDEGDDDEWGDLSDAEIESIKAGLADAAAGRVHSHEYVMAMIDKKFKDFAEKKHE